jgi:hypothetical protein
MSLAQIRQRYIAPMPFLKKLFWVYFLLLIFEGALRKWIVPGLSAPLLLVRDPIGLLIIAEAYRENKWPEKWSAVTGVLGVLLLGLCVVQLVAGNNPWFAALYGLRSYLLPFPIAFIMGENLDEEDLRKFGVVTLWILLPMTLLDIAQYLAPADSFLNNGAYEGGAQITYVGARVRASGTFSFVTGLSNFTPLAAAFILYGFVREKMAPRWLLWSASFALLLSIPVIGSRTLVFELAGVALCAAIGALCGVTQLFQSLKFAAPLLVVSFLVSLLPVFSEASLNLRTRFSEASKAEGTVEQSVQQRTLGSIFYTFDQTDFLSNPFGLGIGAGAAAITKLTQGEVQFLAGEDEFSRVIYEFGPFPGIFFMLFRLLLAVFFVAAAIDRARRQEPLALLLVPLTFTTLFLGVMEQPTGQGFMVMGLAFSIAAIKKIQSARAAQRGFAPRLSVSNRPGIR